MEGSSWLDALVAQATDVMADVTGSPVQVAAHLAALVGVACVAAGALSRTMLPLRWLAVASNVGLLLYGALRPSPITAVVAAVLLPINLWRAVQITRLSRRVLRAGLAAELASVWLRPHMKKRRYPAGHTLFSRGDPADKLYLLADGDLELADIGVAIEPGRIFGEIALFSAHHTRTQTVRCRTACTVLEIHEHTVRQLFYEHPSFAFHLCGLLAERLGSDVARAQRSESTA